MGQQKSDSKSLILGTAGHIDHGKSSLIKALTGTDPDRLAEEKRRGITIELGFARLDLPSGRHMGVVDVPGHERFVRQMVAGATGVDVALIVIAADDGVMPQTTEHIAVLELLGVSNAVVALTKTDLVDEEWLEFIKSDVEAKLADTPFADAAIVPVSSRTGEGLDELREAIDAAASRAERTKDEGGVRMPIDRVFTVKGIGTVVTGTLWSGQVSEGMELQLLPSEKLARVRSVQMHGKDVPCAGAGNRVAVCLSGLAKEDIQVGDFLCEPGQLTPSDRFDAEFVYCDPFAFGRPLKTGTRVHVDHGTREVLGRILFMNGQEQLDSKQKAKVQIRLEEPLPLTYKDRFVVRSYSPVHVIGGGMVLNAHPRRRTNLAQAEAEMLDALEEGNQEKAIGKQLELADLPMTLSQIVSATGVDEASAQSILDQMRTESRAMVLGQGAGSLYLRAALLQKLLTQIEHALLNFHTKNPNESGLSKGSFKQQVMTNMPEDVFSALLAEAADRGLIVSSGGEIAHPKAGAGAQKAEEEAAKKIEKALLEAADVPPDLTDIAQKTKIDMALARKAALKLANAGAIVRVEGDRYYHASIIKRYKEQIAQAIKAGGPAKASELKECMGTTRKYAMPLLEYFDSIGFTKRDGDFRTLV